MVVLRGPHWFVLKVWYFFYFSSISTILPYLNLYFRRIGLSEQQIGLLTAFRTWISFPAGSLWSGMADKLQAHRAVLLLLFTMSTVLRLSLAVAHSFGVTMALVLGSDFFTAAITIIVDAAVMAACTKEGDFGKQRLYASIGWGIFSFVSGAIINHTGIRASFVCHAILSLLTGVPTALLPLGPLLSKLNGNTNSSNSGGRHSPVGGVGECTAAQGSKGLSEVELSRPARELERLPQQEGHRWTEECPQGQQASRGGRDRVGSREAVTAAEPCDPHDSEGVEPTAEMERQPLLPGSPDSMPASTHPSERKGSSSSPLAKGRQQAAGGCLTSDLQQGRAGEGERPRPEGQHQQPLPGQAESLGAEQGCKGGQASVQYWQGMRHLLLNPHALVFFGMVLAMGYGVGNIEGYLFLYLDSLGATETLMGLSLTVTCAAEFLVFLFSGHIIQALGDKLCMHLVFLAFLVRLLCYATLAHWGSPWKVLPVEVLHGFTFALAWGAGTAFVSKIAPPGLETTTQALFAGLYYGLGFGIGGLVGGILYQQQGPEQMYWVAFTVMLASWIMAGVAELFLGRYFPSEWALPEESVEVAATCEDKDA